MKFLELAKNRYSVRSFEPKKVESEKLDLILEAGRIAPTASNRQPQRILVIESEKGLDMIKECTRYHFNAPVILIVCYDQSISWKRPMDGDDAGIVDASIVTTHMMLQTAELGLGSTWVAHFNPEKVRELFKLENHIEPVALLPIGYLASNSQPNPRHYERQDIKETVFYNSF
ncbi:MAG: nitroreductase [Tissierellia bacterium]|nr:nitroreductase [Tissierellia bacterium]